ncbi:hypothetical protein [Piscirickettsia litoralis]|uniref:hypothetical protein n=1 Tax=Piscirickettsia litoralis TaxID=1891921 RepID=UPI00138FC186|nr:hypothetical protein [Piscirickettsia litoralis]
MIKINDYQIEVVLNQQQDVASLIAALMAKGILIERINSKENRLEKLFMDIINENEKINRVVA